jgi:protein-disulfide isomerase
MNKIISSSIRCFQTRSFKMVALLLPTVALTSCLEGGSSDAKIKEWVEKNPEVIMKSLMDFQRRQQEESMPKPADVQANADGLFKHAGSPSAGATDGKVKVAYFFDFLCGHCEHQSKTNAAVLAKRGDVQIIYKNLPILSEFSEQIARAALAAHQQGMYKQYYDAFYKLDRGARNPEGLKKIATGLRLDMKRWEADMKGEAVMAELMHVRELAQKMKINGTPAMAIAPNVIIPGRADELEKVIESL